VSAERLRGAALLDALEAGAVRVAERDAGGEWRVHAWIKEELLAILRDAPLASFDGSPAPFVDKRPLAPRRFSPEEGVRVVPGGSAVRRGAHVARGVVMMPPSYVNVGAFVGAGSMIDSHALVGSCAQLGERVHVSAGAQIGGVLEPARARPVIVEDDAFVGGNTGLYDGVLVRRRAVIAAGVVLAAGTALFDVVNERELRGSLERPLEVPEGAVVVPGSRPVVRDGVADAWAGSRRLQIACALIVKYRDERTDRATALEDALR
jgi:2,3,4,5-tetrahydropyridine-2-carboxylate N-succinyltransferase